MHENVTFLDKLSIFSKLFFVSQMFSVFLITKVQEDPRNNKSIESGLSMVT